MNPIIDEIRKLGDKVSEILFVVNQAVMTDVVKIERAILFQDGIKL